MMEIKDTERELKEFRTRIAVRPVGIDYNGYARELAWGPGEPGVDNFLRVLGRTRAQHLDRGRHHYCAARFVSFTIRW